MTSSSFDSTLANLGIGRSGSAATPTVQTQAQSQTLDQSDFLALMTAQLKSGRHLEAMSFSAIFRPSLQQYSIEGAR